MISFGSVDDVASATYVKPNPVTMTNIATGVNAFMANSSHIPRQMMDVVRSGYNAFVESQTGRRIEAMRQQLNHLWEPDTVNKLRTLASLQNAKPLMVRWLMTSQPLRKMVNENTVVGYGDSYVDECPTKMGDQQRDFRLVNEGVLRKGDNNRYQYKRYLEPVRRDDVTISVFDRAAIALSIANMNSYLDTYDADPTSEWNGTMGD